MSQDNVTPDVSHRRDISTPFMAALFIAVGGIVIWDTTSYTDTDSSVFPFTIASTMIGLSLLLVVQWLFGFTAPRPHDPTRDAHSTLRRVVLVAAMLAAGLLMPTLGFLITSVIVFAAILIAAMYDPWTPFRIVVYPVAAAVIVVGFYLLFSRVLQVPLPEGQFPLGF